MNINKLKQILRQKNIQLALLFNINNDYDKNMYYFSEYKGLGCLVVPGKKQAFLIVPEMEYERAKKTSKIKIYKWKKGKRLFETLNEILKKNKIKPEIIGISYENFTLSANKSLKKHIKKIKTKDISNDFLELRKIKTRNEINIMKKSCRIADNILKKCLNSFHKFKTEKDVEIFLHSETIKQGCELAFPTIVASGSSGSMAHYEPGNINLKKGFCVIDFGVKYQGYHSDITRTIYIGAPSKEEKETYNLLLNVQENIIKNIRVNKKCMSSYEETLSLLGKYSDKFTHGLGHGIGLQIHELPNLTAKSENIFKNNMIFTVEPGVYFENKYGIRIEDDILIKVIKR